MSGQSITVAIADQEFTYELNPALAPRTVEQLVASLPADLTAVHGITTGMAVCAELDWKVERVENPIAWGAQPGSLLVFPNAGGRVLDGRVSPNELVLTYGVSRFFDWTGWQPCVHVGSLSGGSLAELLARASEIRAKGRTPITVRVPS
jgi:hypothetical protein